MRPPWRRLLLGRGHHSAGDGRFAARVLNAPTPTECDALNRWYDTVAVRPTTMAYATERRATYLPLSPTRAPRHRKGDQFRDISATRARTAWG
jgi:hypothetical protein